MKKIAITGVIASGKSEVCKIIESLGEEVIYTDKINNELLNDKDYQQKLSLIFPNCIKNDKVDKSLIRQEILQNDDKRKALNSLAHREIKLKVEKIMQKINKKTIFVEIPLIVESNMVEYFLDIRQAPAGGLLHPFFRVSVSVKDDALVSGGIFFNEIVDGQFHVFRLFQLVAGLAKCLGHNGI